MAPTDASSLSILNPRPQKIPGPNLLHLLVPSDGETDRSAIEYQRSDGGIDRVSYRQLHESSSSVANLLSSTFNDATLRKTTTPIVPVFIQQCPHLYTAELAVLKAGAAFCPISLDVPEERLRFLLHDVEAKLLLTTRELKDRLPSLNGISVITVDDYDHGQYDQPISVDISPSQPAYVMYTSGSTGQPKGVVISHFAASQALLAHDRHIPDFNRFLQFASPTFDVSVFEIFFPFFRGQTVVCGERRRLLTDLPGFINRMHIDAAELTPSVASSLLRSRQEVPALKLLLTIGEMLKRDVIEEFGGSATDDGILYGMYGPTEATIHCTLQPSFCKDMSPGTIGVPLDTVSTFIVRPQAEDSPSNHCIEILPIGEEGELAVGGLQLADGYLNRPEQTDLAFVIHPEFGRLYRTGDRAKLTSDGKLDCLGRISSGQVKLRGQRIELGEVEFAAARTQGCHTVVANVIGSTLVIFCVYDPAKTTETDIRETCRKWLPAFMVPAEVVQLAELPYLDSGKVDQKGLEQIYAQRKQGVASTDHNRSSSLHEVKQIVEKVLGVQIDDRTNLGAVGLDSLSAIRLSSQLTKEGFPRPNALTLLEARTVKEIAEALRQPHGSAGDDTIEQGDVTEKAGLREEVFKHPYVLNRSDDVEDIFAPTLVQSAMLIETARNGQAYCNWIEFEVTSTSSLDVVCESIKQLAERHSLLRSGFLEVTDSQTSHAVITWKRLLACQIQHVESFTHEFQITDESDLLRPCSFQLKQSESNIRVLLQIHHALYDQWSIDMLRIDLSNLLLNRKLDERPSFRSVSDFHLSRLKDSHSDERLEFWHEHLRELTPTLLPSMNGKKRPKRLRRTPWHELELNHAHLRSFSQDHNIGLPTVFQSAVAYLIGCYSGSADIIFGTVFSGRHLPIPGIESVFGPCLATLPSRIDYSTTNTCRELLRLIHKQNRVLQKHSLTSLAEIKRAAQHLESEPLFDILFVWQDTSLDASGDADYVREVDSADHHEFSLVLEFEPSPNGIMIRATYQEALISLEQIQTLIAQVHFLGNAIIEEPHRAVESLASCLPNETLSISNPIPQHYSTGHNLTSAIECHAVVRPDSPAVLFASCIKNSIAQTQVLTYKDLNARANKLANYLRSLNVLPNQLICICMEKSVELYIAILATIKAGAGYLPLVPETPSSRIRSILDQTNIKLCLCDSQTARVFGDVKRGMVIDVTAVDLETVDAEDVESSFPGHHVAYTVFTSGSTGQPKGVSVTMGNLLGNIRVLAELYRVDAGDRLLQACSQAFDVSVFEIFFAFYSGICLCLAKKDVLFADIEASIRALGISHLSLTPTVAALIDPDNLPSVRFLVTAGEAVSDLVHRRWAGKGLHQGYGPSETTNICTIKMDVSSHDALGNIGPPLRNTSAFIIAPGMDFSILPAGAVGELAFGGEQVFRGYIGMDQLNAEKICHHPRYGRIYRSGDLGRVLPDGSILISGRLDDQVKIRGNRIELGEVDAILLQDCAIRDCTTLVAGQHATDQCLVSFVVPNHLQDNIAASTKVSVNHREIIRALFKHLQEALPSYMVPSLIVPVNKLPLTSQDKLDRHLLRQLLTTIDTNMKDQCGCEDDDSDTDEDWSAGERQISTSLATVLQIADSEISRHTSFFALGLSSLSAIKLAKLMSNNLQREVSVSDVLRNSTVGRLARAVATRYEYSHLNGDHRQLPLLPPDVLEDAELSCSSLRANIERFLPCTPLQEAMLSGTSLDTQSAYCNSLMLEVRGDLKVLKHCWTNMLERHSMLRTRFVSTRSSSHPYVQVVLKDIPLPWEELHCQSLEDICLPGIKGSADKSRPVDQPKPFCIKVYKAGSTVQLVLHMHHAIYDGISMSRLLEEVELAYKGESLPSPVSFERFLVEAKLQGGQDAIDFWSREMRGFRPRPFTSLLNARDSHETSITVQLPISPTHLQSYCKRHALSQLSVLQTALAKVLACAQNARDVCFGNVVSGRTIPVDGIERLVAPCFNTIPVRANLNKVHTNLELAQMLNQQSIEALAFQLTPLRRIQRFSESRSVHLFDSLLIVQPPQRSLDASIWTIEREHGLMDIPLVFEITPNKERFECILHYSELIISKALAQVICSAFSAALESCLQYPHEDVNHFYEFERCSLFEALAGETNQLVESNGHTASPNTETTKEEDSIRNVFARLSGVDKDVVGGDTSMYRIGLDSLNAAQVAAQLRSLGMDIDAADVMESLTPVALAIRARENRSSRHNTQDRTKLEAVGIEERETIRKRLHMDEQAIEAVLPCTPVQSGMIAQSLHSNGELYVNHISYRIPDSIQTAHLEAAWSAVTARHPVLRMGFHHIEDSPNPFAMSITGSGSANCPFLIDETESEACLAEDRARKFIMRSIETQAWCVQVVNSKGHRLMILSMHHALYDANSLQIILEDLKNSLSMSLAESETSIDNVLSAALAEAADYDGTGASFWSEKLYDSTISKFPDLTPSRSKEIGLGVEDSICEISAETIESFCRENNATIQALGQTVWATLLAAYTGSPSVTFGVIFSGHATPSAVGVAFPSITTIPVSCNTDCSPLQLLERMVGYNASAQRHRFVPLTDMQRLAGHAGQALFDTVFVYQKTLLDDQTFDWPVVRETAAVDYTASMEFEIGENSDVKLRLTFNEARIPQKHATLILQQYDYILRSIVDSQLKHNSSIFSVLPPKEVRLPSPSPFLHGLVEEAVRQWPDRTALHFVYDHTDESSSTGTWTYKDLDDRGNQVAHLIQSSGVQPGSIIAVCMDKCPEASFAFIGILKAGCSFLPIDPNLPLARLEFILNDSSAHLLFVEQARFSKANLENVPVIQLSESSLVGVSSNPVTLTTLSHEENCYCLYTSGTTGAPKGCEISHENAVQAMMAFQRLFAGRWTPTSRWLQFASFWFDVSVLEQFWSWSVGITVIGAPRDLVLEDLAGFLRRHSITHLDLTPSLARLLKPEDVPSLWEGVFITGGEALKQEIIDSWGPKRTICNGYGPTEATIGVTMNTFIGSDAKPSNIGRPFDNVGIYLLRPGSDEPVIRGAIGELCVSGKLVGKGYLNRPELTDRHFPFLDRFRAKVYRTGDLVRLLADGSVAFIGREDSQAKLRGQRLEITEIDNVIQSCAAEIAHILSLVIKSDNDRKEMLISFFTVNAQRETETLDFDSSRPARELAKRAKESCINQLPGYMVPTHILAINFLPLTVNNKVDTKRLKTLFSSFSPKDPQDLDDDADDASTITPSEQEILAVLGKLLSIKPQELTLQSNLFSLGLSSITAISFSTSLKRAGFKHASVATIMQNPTLTGLSKAMADVNDDEQAANRSIEQAKLQMKAFARRYLNVAASRLECDIDKIETVAPCTPLQQGLILDSLRDDSRPYFNDFRYVVSKADKNRLRVSLQKLIDGTQILRTQLFHTDEGFAQAVLVDHRHTIREWSAGSEDFESILSAKKQRWIKENISDLRLPFEVHIIDTADQLSLVIHIHHALYDGVSYDLLIDALGEIYLDRRRADSTPDFTDALPYGPLRPLEDGKGFWEDRLRYCQYVPLPEIDENTVVDHILEKSTFNLGSELEAARKDFGVSHQALMQSCFEIALHQCIASVQTYGIVVSGRSIELEGGDRVLGPMFNTLPHPLSTAESTLKGYIRECHRMNVDAIPFQQTPLRDIRKWCGQPTSHPMFDVLFIFQSDPSYEEQGKGTFLTPVERPPRADYPLTFEVTMANDDSMDVTALAQGRFFTRDSVKLLLDRFQEVMHVALYNGNASIKEAFGINSLSGRVKLECGTSGNARDTTLQVNGAQVDGFNEFEWTLHARDIRNEIARLAGLSIDDVDQHTTIFALGLDSIDAVKLTSRLKKLGITIPVSKVLQAQTIPRMINAMQDRSASANAPVQQRTLLELGRQLEQLQLSRMLSNSHRRIERVLSATPNQEALIAKMLQSQMREYFNHDVLRLRSDTDLDRLQRAWQTVVDANPILRTCFIEVSDPEIKVAFAQVIHQPSSLNFEKYEADSVHGFDGVFDKIRQDVLLKFNEEPPLRLAVLRSESERYLILSLTHAQYDGHSLALLHEDVQMAYDDKLEARPGNDDATEAGLVATNDDAMHFWEGALSGVEIRSFPRHRSHGDEQRTHRAEKQSAVIPTAARSFCQSHGVSMQALAQTCWALTLAHYTQYIEVLFGVVLACRDSEEAERVMFPTMNTVVMRASLHGSRKQMVQYVQSLITDILPYHRTPLRMIQAAAAKVGRISSGGLDNGLFDTLFVYQHKPSTQMPHQEPLYDSVGGSSNVEYPVAVEFEDIGDALVIRAACKDNTVDERGTEQLLDHVDTILQAVINSPDKPTVDFKAESVSICGLKSFSLHPSSGKQDSGHGQVVTTGDSREVDSVLASSIAEVMAKVSKIPVGDISMTTTIESIGLDSISAIKVAALLRKQSINLSVSEIIRAKTPARMARVSEKKARPPATPERSSTDIISEALERMSVKTAIAKAGFEESDVECVLPATAGQIYMISMWQKTGGQLFHPTFSYQFKTGQDVEKVQEAWNALVAHHPILRTVFCSTEDDETPILQIVSRHAARSFQSDDDDSALISARQPMVVLRTLKNEAGYQLDFHIHHALYDAISLPLMMRDFQLLLTGRKPASSKLRYEDFLALSVAAQAQQERKQFWTKYLEGAKPMQLPQPTTTGQQKRVEIFKPAMYSNAAELEVIARRESLSTQALLFAANAKAYANLAGQRQNNEAETDVILGIYLSNRSHLPDLDTLATPVLNLVPLLIRSPQQKSLLETARQIQADLQEIGTPERSAVGLWEIAEWSCVKIDTFVNFLKVPDRNEVDFTDNPTKDAVIHELDDRRTQKRQQVVEPYGEKFNMPPELQKIRGLNAYQHSLDIEMTITDGKLNVGLFCPEAVSSLEQCTEALEEFQGTLEKFVGKMKE